MSNLRERRLMLCVGMRWHHLVLDNFRSMGRGTIAFLVLVVIVTAVEVGWAFVFTRTAMILISVDELSHICG
jgi:hypothetical protein